MITKFSEFEPQFLTTGEPRSGKYGQTYTPILYKGQKLEFTTGKCFSWGLQKDFKGVGYKLPIVLGDTQDTTPSQDELLEFLYDVAKFAGKQVSPQQSVEPRKMLSCIFAKEGKVTLYARVEYNSTTEQFYNNFFGRGERVRRLDPKEIMGRRCEVNAVICPESIFVSKENISVQVRVTKVLMELDEAEEQVIGTLLEEW